MPWQWPVVAQPRTIPLRTNDRAQEMDKEGKSEAATATMSGGGASAITVDHDDSQPQPRSGSVTNIRNLQDGEKMLRVVDTAEEAADGAEENVEFCVLGSPYHLKVLKQRVQCLQEQAAEALREKEVASERADGICTELDRFKLELQNLGKPLHHSLTMDSGPHHTVKVR